ncbi:dephospho-CoA kinase [Shimia abyssi]|uniref:dephospho-CoA kinase n=1 Tax=Shimia abyssi TaxID=1662395 RepID=UPI000D0E1302|nr:dephospho-CoA kinase [Shimia abyssi]
MFRLGLTGSIGMGKSTTAKMFADAGCALWDADAAVHRLYAEGGAAVEPIRKVLPTAIVDGAVSRDVLKQLIAQNKDVLRVLEDIVHPLVAEDRADFAERVEAKILVFDIPLLFESNGHKEVDAVVCVSVSPDLQKKRVLARGTMSEAQFERIRARQMPNDQKCARSDYVVSTDTLDHARAQVDAIIAEIKERIADA